MTSIDLKYIHHWFDEGAHNAIWEISLRDMDILDYDAFIGEIREVCDRYVKQDSI